MNILCKLEVSRLIVTCKLIDSVINSSIAKDEHILLIGHIVLKQSTPNKQL